MQRIRARSRLLGDSLSRRCRSHLSLDWRARKSVLSLGTVKVGPRTVSCPSILLDKIFNRFKIIGHNARTLHSVFEKTISTELMLVTQNFYPTIYALNDPHPIAICKSTVLPDGSPIPRGERTYANACTIKVLSPSVGSRKCVHRNDSMGLLGVHL